MNVHGANCQEDVLRSHTPAREIPGSRHISRCHRTERDEADYHLSALARVNVKLG